MRPPIRSFFSGPGIGRATRPGPALTSDIRRKRFQEERIEITDRFLGMVLPYFSSYPLPAESSDIDKFLWINRELRRQNTETFFSLRDRTSPKKLWEGVWLSQANAANMSRFGERRQYYYKGQKVDEQIHLGVDLASLAHSPIQAANHGRVIYRGSTGHLRADGDPGPRPGARLGVCPSEQDRGVSRPGSQEGRCDRDFRSNRACRGRPSPLQRDGRWGLRRPP